MSQEPVFKKAVKSMTKAKIALIGPSGSGKTLSGIKLGKGLSNNGKVGVVDSENNSASLYVDKFPGWDYFTLPISPPYTPEKYIKAIDYAIAEKIDVLVIDSLTHVWAGEGGIMAIKDAIDARGGNSFANWAKVTPRFEALRSKILHADIHIIATMRSKQEYIIEQTDKGKQAPRKVGLAPIMRDGIEYEFTVAFEVGMDHQATVSKDRTDLFNGLTEMIDETTGERIKGWLAGDIKTPDTKEPEKKPDDKAPPEKPDNPPAGNSKPKTDSKPKGNAKPKDPIPNHAPQGSGKKSTREYSKERGSATINQKDAIMQECLKRDIDPTYYLDPEDLNTISQQQAADAWEKLRAMP